MSEVRDERFEYIEGSDIPIYTPEHWGKSHANNLLYVEIRCLDHKGQLKPASLSTNEKRHHWEAQARGRLNTKENPWEASYATQIKGGECPCSLHDDWDCLDDMEDAGLLLSTGAPNFLAFLTPIGVEVALELRKHKHLGKSLDEFDFVQAIEQAKLKLTVEAPAEDDIFGNLKDILARYKSKFCECGDCGFIPEGKPDYSSMRSSGWSNDECSQTICPSCGSALLDDSICVEMRNQAEFIQEFVKECLSLINDETITRNRRDEE